MISFKNFRADALNETKEEDIEYYKKDGQTIWISSKHAMEDGANRNRIWWNDKNHLKDPSFTDFADKCLNRIKTAPEVDSNGMPFPEEDVSSRIGFCNFNEKRGWIVSLRKSEDGSWTSFCIVTVLNMDAKSMNPNLSLFAGTPRYIINVDKMSKSEPRISKEDSEKQELKDLYKKIHDLQNDYEWAKMELEELENEKERKEKQKEINKLRANLEIQVNRKQRLVKQYGAEA